MADALPHSRSSQSRSVRLLRLRQNVLRRKKPEFGATRDVTQIQQSAWPEVNRLLASGLAGYWSLAVFLVVGHAACHITGPSVVVSVVIASVTAVLSSLCLSELLTRPGVTSGSAYGAIYELLGELPAFAVAWIDILVHVAAITSCSRSLTATIDKTTNNRVHDFILNTFGFTPYLQTFPDFLAGGACMITALFIAAGLEHSRTLQRCLNVLTAVALTFILSVCVWEADPKTLKEQPFQLDGSNGVMVSAAVCCLVFSGSHEIGRQSKMSSSQPHRMIPMANGVNQMVMAITLILISVLLPLVAKLSPLGLVPEVPLLQAFEGGGWPHLLIAGAGIICLSFTLLELTIPLHKAIQTLVRDGLLFSFLGVHFPRTDTPFMGSVVVGAVTATIATLGDVTRLLLVAAAGRVTMDLLIASFALALRYGVGLNYSASATGRLADLDAKQKIRRLKSKTKRQLARDRRMQQLRHGLNTLKTSISAHTTLSSSSNFEGFGGSGLEVQTNQPQQERPKTSKIRRLLRIGAQEAGGGSNPGPATSFGNADTQPLVDDLPSDTESSASESSPSGYETDSSNDTDIDALVEEYRETCGVATVMENQSTASPPSPRTTPVPTRTSSRCVLYALLVLTVVLSMQCIVLAHFSWTSPNSIVLNMAVTVTGFLLLFLISRQPENTIGGVEATFLVPLSPWSHGITVFLLLSLFYRVMAVSWIELSLWGVMGLSLYFGYGLQHSSAVVSVQRLPRRPTTLAGLIPASTSACTLTTPIPSPEVR